MLSFLSNRATAAHLAIAAVAPLVLCKYLPTGSVCHVLTWLTLVCVVWAVMAPSRYGEENSVMARRRFLGHMASDPAFWVLAAVLVYSSVVALNSGVSLAYDAELKIWSLKEPAATMLPGGVRGACGGYFAMSLLALALYPAVAHALDSRQSVYFAITASFVVLTDAVYAYVSGAGIPSGSAAAYGLWALVSSAAMFSAERSRQRPKELVSALSLSGCLAALLFIGRPVTLIVFAAATFVLAVLFTAFRFRELGVLGVIRSFLMLFVAAAIAAVVYHWRSGDWETLAAAWGSPVDSVFSRMAVAAWESAPWTGSGAGSFPLVVKIGATPEDWASLGAIPDFTGNGWRTLLVERGMIGVLVTAVAFGALLFTWFRNAVKRGLDGFAAAVPLLPLAIAALSVVMVFDGSALRVEAILAFVSLAAFSVNGGQ